MKKKYCLLGFIVCAFYACLEDKGNDVYRGLNDVTIGNIENRTVEQFAHLQITPEITVSDGNFNPENYTYLWHMYVTYGSTNPRTSDTLSFEKDLDVEVTSIPGDYSLILEVKDKDTGIQYMPARRTQITVVNSYSKGMMALSNVNGEANMTFVNVVGSVVEDAYQKVNGEIAGKNPTGVRYVSGMLAAAEKMVVIMTDDERGGVVVKPLDMSYVMDFKDMFYFQPEVVKPQSFGTHSITAFEYVNNNGILYRRDNGESGYPKYGVAVKGDYEKIAPFDFFYSLVNYRAYFYDQGKERFISMKCPLQYDEIITLPDDLTGEFNPNSVGMQMVWGGLFGNEFSMSSGRAVMVDDLGEHYMLSFEVGKDKDDNPQFSPKKKIKLSHPGGKEAHTFTTSQKANFLYYGYAGKIASVSFDTGNLLMEYEVGGGNVDYIECDQVGNTNQMWVGVSDGSGAKNSGSIVVLEMSTDGSLKEVARYKNVCGKVVDFEYKK